MWNVLRSVIFGDGSSSRFAESRRRQKAISPVVAETQVLENREVMSATTIHNWNDELLEAIRTEPWLLRWHHEPWRLSARRCLML